jgi:hypothetical protein
MRSTCRLAVPIRREHQHGIERKVIGPATSIDAKFLMVGLRAGSLSLINMISLFAGSHLSYLADLLHDRRYCCSIQLLVIISSSPMENFASTPIDTYSDNGLKWLCTDLPAEYASEEEVKRLHQREGVSCQPVYESAEEYIRRDEKVCLSYLLYAFDRLHSMEVFEVKAFEMHEE